MLLCHVIFFGGPSGRGLDDDARDAHGDRRAAADREVAVPDGRAHLREPLSLRS